MRMRWTRCIAAGSSLVAAALVAPGARAQQIDVNPPKPNVLLLVDNSGSMERMIDGSLPEATAANTCDVSGCTVDPVNGTTCTWGATSPVPNRWNTMINALNGTPSNGFHCIAMPRDQGAGSDFVQEYQINGVAPYDSGYYLPYHRAIGLDTTTKGAGVKIPCTYAPGDLPGAITGAGVGPNKYGAGAGITADQFPGSAIVMRPYGQVTIDQSAGHTMSCAFGQLSDGILAVYQDIARFGLMTFDQDPSPATGVSASSPFSVLSPAQGGAFTGMWSYYPNWGGGGAGVPAQGNPLTCSTGAQAFEVGARNPAAPPWEGRMIEFPPASDATGARQTQNQQIRSVLAASRPYGGTPIAGMFADAKTYLWSDSTGPSASVLNPPTFGDPYVQGGCRQQFIILLTDGAPNQDMRPSCGNADNPSTPCPYDQPETNVAALLAGTGGHQPVQTFVVGFAVSNGTDNNNAPVDCTTLDPTSTACSAGNVTASLAPCCALQRIAVAGQPPLGATLPDGQIQQIQPRAYFVNTATGLSAALSSIMAQIAEGQTTRAVPAYSPVASTVTYSASTLSNQNSFYASFLPGVPTPSGGNLASVGEPWTGNIQRSRYLCSTHAPDTLTTGMGDDFGKNLALSSTRHFITVQPSATPSLDATATIRPYDTAPGDGLGTYTGTQYSDTAANLVSVITPATLNLSACNYLSTAGGPATLTPAQCAAMLLDFTFGQAFSASGFPFVSRAGTTAQGEALAFGGIYHATPVVVGPPGSLLHDDSYDLFRTSTQTTTAGLAPVSSPKARDTLVYAATTDGLLHAFWADVGLTGGGQVNNEEWAFLPPAVMPKLQGAYPGADKFLLDGTPVVKDVVWDRKQGSLGTTGANPWRTTLVASFGPSQLGFYALDVTNPVFATKAGNYTETGASDPGGPAFLWQLTKTPAATNVQLFGAHGATPAITQVAITEGDGAVHEVGVAILPGGWDTAPTTPFVSPGCERYAHNKAITPDWGPTAGYAPRVDVRCWGASGKFADPVVGRSVTIVRLDTGEVLASFMRKVDAPLNDTLRQAGRIIDTPLDSPMTGTPAVYSSQTGADATKFFIGDIDGTIWRFDISSADPTQWKGKLFYDLYNTGVDNQTSSNDWANGQPIQVPLVTALDPQGRLVVIAASGGTDSFDQTGPNFIASLTETVQTISGVTDFHAGVNWYVASALPGGTQLSPTPAMSVGERVSGPMVVFNGSLYFTTYVAAAASSASCSQGDPRLYGFDFIHPSTSGVASGGTLTITPAAGHLYQDLGLLAAVGGAVVPGISVQQTTACATTTSGADQYVAGATHTSTSTYTAGSFSLVALTGKSNQSNGVGTLNIPLNAPNSATLIDSWATVTE